MVSSLDHMNESLLLVLIQRNHTGKTNVIKCYLNVFTEVYTLVHISIISLE